jgi:hypothetical protein
MPPKTPKINKKISPISQPFESSRIVGNKKPAKPKIKLPIPTYWYKEFSLKAYLPLSSGANFLLACLKMNE